MAKSKNNIKIVNITCGPGHVLRTPIKDVEGKVCNFCMEDIKCEITRSCVTAHFQRLGPTYLLTPVKNQWGWRTLEVIVLEELFITSENVTRVKGLYQTDETHVNGWEAQYSIIELEIHH